MHKAPSAEERLKKVLKVGDIVRVQETRVSLWLPNGMIGIVTKLYHGGNDALVLLSDGKLFLDRVDRFVVL